MEAQQCVELTLTNRSRAYPEGWEAEDVGNKKDAALRRENSMFGFEGIKEKRYGIIYS